MAKRQRPAAPATKECGRCGDCGLVATQVPYLDGIRIDVVDVEGRARHKTYVPGASLAAARVSKHPPCGRELECPKRIDVTAGVARFG